jgi:hypothetical protein
LAFQSALPSSKKFRLRLIELTAAALHQIAVLLFSRDDLLHDPSTTNGLDVKEVTLWEHPPTPFHRLTPYNTLFTNPYFTAQHQYPDGIADTVGYWAEDQIFGGVALFDHSRPWDEEEEPNLYIQSAHYNTTYRICQLLDEQQELLLKLLNRDGSKNPPNSVLPILPGPDNRVRIDMVSAIPVHKVYRDAWEREPPQLLLYHVREPDRVSRLDYPELEEDPNDRVKRLNDIWEKCQAKQKQVEEEEMAKKETVQKEGSLE